MVKIKDVIAYIQGNLRYRLYYSKYFKCLIPGYIKEQINIRINSMNPQCYSDGSCIECGCKTTALQMANKACDGNCYPRMLNKFGWNHLKNCKENNIYVSIDKFSWRLENNKFIKI